MEDENSRLQKESQKINITNKTLEDELICMKHKIEKFDNFGEELILLKNKLENIGRFENTVNSEIKSLCETIPLYTNSHTKNPNIKNKNTDTQLESLLIRYMLPSIITVAAIVMNMYLYLSNNKKFPI